MKIFDFGHRMLISKRGHMVAFLALYVLLAVEYVRFVYRNYSYLMGFDLRMNPVTLMTGLLFLVILVWVMFATPRPDEGAYAVSMIVAVLFCLPAIVMYQLAGTSGFIPLYTLLFLILLRTPLLRLQPWPLPRIPVRWQRWVLPAVCILCLLPFPLAYGFHIDWSVFSMGSHTYDVRAEVATHNNLLTAYLLGPLRMVLLPMLMVYGLVNIKRDWWMTLVGVLGMLLLFMLNPQKSIFFSIAVVLVFFLFKSYHAKAGMLLYGLTVVCIATVLLNLATRNLMAESIVVRRLFFIPVIVCDNYFTFFDGHPVCLSHSFLGHWFDYPYEMEPSRLIGTMMYNRATTNCNTGIVADGFMNFGHLGALFFVSAGALLLRYIDAHLGNARFFGLLALLTITFLNSALFTSLLTHGGLVLLLAALFLIPEGRRET